MSLLPAEAGFYPVMPVVGGSRRWKRLVDTAPIAKDIDFPEIPQEDGPLLTHDESAIESGFEIGQSQSREGGLDFVIAKVDDELVPSEWLTTRISDCASVVTRVGLSGGARRMCLHGFG